MLVWGLRLGKEGTYDADFIAEIEIEPVDQIGVTSAQNWSYMGMRFLINASKQGYQLYRKREITKIYYSKLINDERETAIETYFPCLLA